MTRKIGAAYVWIIVFMNYASVCVCMCEMMKQSMGVYVEDGVVCVCIRRTSFMVTISIHSYSSLLTVTAAAS